MSDSTSSNRTGSKRQFSLAALLLLFLLVGLFSAFVSQNQRARELEIEVETLRAGMAELTRLQAARRVPKQQDVELIQRFGPDHPTVPENEQKPRLIE